MYPALYYEDYRLANVTSCPKLLEELSNTDSYIVMCSVARNPKCQIHILEKFSSNNKYVIVFSIKNNPNCTPKLREAIVIMQEITSDKL